VPEETRAPNLLIRSQMPQASTSQPVHVVRSRHHRAMLPSPVRTGLHRHLATRTRPDAAPLKQTSNLGAIHVHIGHSNNLFTQVKRCAARDSNPEPADQESAVDAPTPPEITVAKASPRSDPPVLTHPGTSRLVPALAPARDH
jgi:hypothetical protein